ncbi:D-glycero-alpha-D-manno-heptose-1,7-bisphosphate 7-phosphatase [Arcticibacter sp. MXS-1]|uniref:D-glycero-alpha-D-manno-heptose-1,7-bisphosphate 7-phosphatase n=1 Tax=Arcticibacter sp. MXS-1 TaxID=3341726 RepID=UPI0035A8384C
MNKAVFVDKDGTLIPDIPYNTDPALITLQENTAEGLRQLQSEGYLIIIISNQAGVARGIFEEKALDAVIGRMRELLQEQDVRLDGFYYCPHHPEGTVAGYAVECDCRKPSPGMIQRAVRDFDIDPFQSWMIGDILNDVEAGKRAGCRSILLDNGNETEWVISECRIPDYVVQNIDEAAMLILKRKIPSVLDV